VKLAAASALLLTAATLHAQTLQQTATVTTTRSSVSLGATANTVTTLSASDLTQYPALTLDERLRQHAGFELFRRSSTWVANPTSEGISLRGLGSTAASRTLVLSSGVPLNDSFGGYIHWTELPPETVEAVTLASGGGSDLYGSSALGGVIDLVPAIPTETLFAADLAQASEDTTNLSARADLQQRNFHELLAAQSFRTAGYTTIAPTLRGKVDIPSNVHFENARLELDRALDRTPFQTQRLFLLGNLLNEARSNGTPDQTNGTRLWRTILGDDWQQSDRLNGRIRLFGTEEAYRQAFSAINPTRSAETLTRLQHVRTQEAGASTDASCHLARVAFIAGADLRDLRATDLENPITGGIVSGVQDTSARQRFFGSFLEALAERGPWSAALSLRGDYAANLATHTLTQTAAAPQTITPIPNRTEGIFSPRLGLARQLPHNLALHASAFRAFRTPTMNELYRTGQVGSQTTLANASLVSERATGTEAGATYTAPRLSAQATYFFTQIDRPVSAVLLAFTPTTQTLKRENLGQIQSQGVELAAQTQLTRILALDAGYEYAHATVTNFSAQPALVGLWIPQVPRHTATAQLRFHPAARYRITLAARETGHAFDDSSNLYKLHAFFVLDASAEAHLTPHLTPYLAFQNLLNRSIETARTPNLTLGTPFTAQGGLRLNW
jgi:outer membrane receptor protein involved in Fe transport